MDKLESRYYEKKIVKEGTKNNLCLICMDSTNICLYKKNFYHFAYNKKTYADWFYLCQYHLNSADFLESSKIEEIGLLKAEISKLNAEIKKLQSQINQEKGKAIAPEWLSNAISSTGSYLKGKITDPVVEKEEDTKPKEDEMKVVKKTDKEKMEDLLDNITGKEQQIKRLEETTKYYKLSELTYINRKDALESSLKQKFIKPKAVDLPKATTTTSTSTGGLKFPSAPTHDL